MRHPAKFTSSIMPVLARHLNCNEDEHGAAVVLDPFAGTGRIHELRAAGFYTVGIELEPEWAALHPGTRVGNALALPADWTGRFDAVVTSCTYGNRMADHHEAKDGSRRNTYTHALGRKLHPDNSGAMQWGPAYQDFHRQAWAEAWRVLRPGGLLVLNVSDHIRKGRQVPVVRWHIETLGDLGFALVDWDRVETPRQRQGANGHLRVAYEVVGTFRKAPGIRLPV